MLPLLLRFCAGFVSPNTPTADTHNLPRANTHNPNDGARTPNPQPPNLKPQPQTPTPKPQTTTGQVHLARQANDLLDLHGVQLDGILETFEAELQANQARGGPACALVGEGEVEGKQRALGSRSLSRAPKLPPAYRPPPSTSQPSPHSPKNPNPTNPPPPRNDD